MLRRKFAGKFVNAGAKTRVMNTNTNKDLGRTATERPIICYNIYAQIGLGLFIRLRRHF